MLRRPSFRNGGVVLATAMLVGGALAIVAPAASAAAAPRVTFNASPYVEGSNVTIGYSVNRKSAAIASRSCTLSYGSTVMTVGCGYQTSGIKARTTVFTATLTGLDNGAYTYTVMVRLTDGGRATATTAAFTISTGQCFDNDQESAPDLEVTPSVNVADNGIAYESTNGTCTGGSFEPVTVVQADDHSAARALCVTLTGTTDVLGTTTLRAFRYESAPDDYYVCSPSP